MKNDKSIYQVFSKPILFLSGLLLATGIFCYTRMQTNLFPEVMFPRISIIVEAGQQPVDRMMITVTKPLEAAVKKVTGVTIVKSSTSRGSCDIEVFFNWGLNIYGLKTQVESRINEIKNYLPPGITISAEAMNQSLFPVYGFTLESKEFSPVALRDAANLTARPVFSQVAGISNVVIRGGKAKEFVVIPDAAKMSSLGLSQASLVNVFNNTNFVQSNGYMADYSRLYLTLTDTRVADNDALGNITVKNDGSRLVKLKDIAQLQIQEQQEFIKINANGTEAVLIDLVKQPGVDLLTFAKDAAAKAEEVRKLLPKGYELKPYYDQSAFVGDSIHSVIKTIYEGLFLAIIVMILFLRSWRASLAVMLTIPVTLAFSIFVLYLAGITINIMSLGAIAASVGLIIDDAIVIIEQIYRGHEENPDEDRFSVVKKAIHDLFPAMVASSLSTIVIHFPFRLMSGLAGAFFKELSDTMQLTMVTSFLVTWLLLPVLHLIIGYKTVLKPKHPKDHVGDTARKLHWLTWLFTKPVIAFTFVAALGFGAWMASKQLQTGFLPDLDEGTIVLDYHSPAGTDIEETDRLCRQMEKIILAHPDVETYSRRTGVAMSFQSKPPNFGDYSIQLKKTRKKTTPQVTSDLRQSISQAVPLMNIDFGQRISDLLGDLMSTPQPVEIKIFGADYLTLQKLAIEADSILVHVNGIADIQNGLVTAGPSLVFLPDQDKLNQYKISLLDIQSQISGYTGGVPLGANANIIEPSPAQAAMTGGIQIGQLQDGEQMRRILMRFTDFSKNDLDKLQRQLIFLPDGTTRPLSFFSKLQVIPGEMDQKREDLKSNIILTARLNGRDLGSTIAEIQRQFKQQLALPQGYSVSYGGAYSQQQQSFKELLMILGLAVVFVFGVLLFLFKEWLISFVILFISVTGICGCILALYLANIPLNVSSYTGIIMIVGILAENAIFTVYQFKTNLLHNGDVEAAVDYAIAMRLRPKLMTAIGAILALSPLAMGIGLGAQMQQPLAVAVIGGFATGLPLLLLVLPSFMLLIYKKRGRKPAKISAA